MAAQGGKELEVSVRFGDATFTASGPADLVMRALGDFREMVAATPPKPERRAKGDELKVDSDSAEVPSIDKPLATFVRRNWSNQAAKATAIVLWARERDEKAALKPSEVESYWRKTSGSAVKNPSQVCADAVKKGWLHNEGNGTYSVTQPGVDAVTATPLE
jgi:hypothetical protein